MTHRVVLCRQELTDYYSLYKPGSVRSLEINDVDITGRLCNLDCNYGIFLIDEFTR